MTARNMIELTGEQLNLLPLGRSIIESSATRQLMLSVFKVEMNEQQKVESFKSMPCRLHLSFRISLIAAS